MIEIKIEQKKQPYGKEIGDKQMKSGDAPSHFGLASMLNLPLQVIK